jgi:hypothetical protein
MFSHLNFAMDGLYPGMFSPAALATGGAYETQVTIEPVVVSPGGGGGYMPWTPSVGTKPDRYRVTVIVRFNGKEYRDVQIVDDTTARVFAEFHGIKEFSSESVMVSVNGVQVIQEQQEVAIKVSLL